MKTRELGLVLAQQLMGVEDLHYGYWDVDTDPQLDDLKTAQARYSQVLIESIEACAPPGARILDIGCGTGHLLVQLLDRGFHVDGVIPDDHLERQVRNRLDARSGGYSSRIFGEKFENLTQLDDLEKYDLLLFSESFQYIPYQKNIACWPEFLKPDGHVLICDFFKSAHEGDGERGDGIFRGGHAHAEFTEYLNRSNIRIVSDEDITRNTSPSIGLLNDLLMERIHPALGTMDNYLSMRKPWLYSAVRWLFRGRTRKISEKYFTGLRSKEVFERYKTYRLMVLKPLA